MESSVKFVCVDVEANELNASTITEIGLAILDTEDIEDVPPGENGKNWLPYIAAHHLRISEYRSIVNSRYVQGCPDAFDFGFANPRPIVLRPLTVITVRASSSTRRISAFVWASLLETPTANTRVTLSLLDTK